jgi:YD repeat-containing protein
MRSGYRLTGPKARQTDGRGLVMEPADRDGNRITYTYDLYHATVTVDDGAEIVFHPLSSHAPEKEEPGPMTVYVYSNEGRLSRILRPTPVEDLGAAEMNEN